LHRGNHIHGAPPANYNQVLREQMQQIENSYLQGNLTNQQLLDQLDRVENEMMKKLINKEIFLHSDDPWIGN